MNNQEIIDAIGSALNNLCENNEMLHDYWITELYDFTTDEPIEENWNEDNLKLIETDVMNQILAWVLLIFYYENLLRHC